MPVGNLMINGEESADCFLVKEVATKTSCFFHCFFCLVKRGRKDKTVTFGSSDSDEKRINETVLNRPRLLMAGAASYPDLPSGLRKYEKTML